MNEDQLITGKVAKILNARDLVINRGSAHGVALGMRFAVLDAKGENIADPETGESLGSVERTKVEVEVIDVLEKLAVARTFRKWTKNVGGNLVNWPGLQKSLQPPKYVERWQTLKTDESTWEDLDEADSYVKTGDPVRQVLEDEEVIPTSAHDLD